MNIADEVEQAAIRKKRLEEKKQTKARAQAQKMANFDAAVETPLAASRSSLDGEIASFGKAKTALKAYLMDQVKSRKLLHFGKYNSIGLTSKFRSRAKPYAIRLHPNPEPGVKITTDTHITYLKDLLYAMLAEDLRRPNEATARPEDNQLVRRLPIISELFLNPESRRLKRLQEECIAAMASPVDNPIYNKLVQEYKGKILYDGGYFRVFAIQFVPNKGTNRYPCWEATTEPVYKLNDAEWVVHERHLVLTENGTRFLHKSAMVGFALAEYSLGDDVDPVRLAFADECHDKFLKREARLASAQNRRPTLSRKRRQPATYVL